MSESLRSFWIVPRGAVQTRGFGVTAFSEDDALRLLRDAGHELPQDTDSLQITAGIRPVDLDAKHITPNCGPAVVRGVWYPFTRVGV
jgi:hypothetical protein